MRQETIARNYAEALVALADKAGAVEAWGELIDVTAAAMSTPSIEAVFMSPRVPKERKIEILIEAMGTAPKAYLLFLSSIVRRGRQMILGKIADEYRHLVDAKLNRVRAGVTVAHEVDALAKNVIVDRLSKAIGKDVIAAFTTDAALLGGVVVRIGDRVYDGSVRKRLSVLRQKLLNG